MNSLGLRLGDHKLKVIDVARETGLHRNTITLQGHESGTWWAQIGHEQEIKGARSTEAENKKPAEPCAERVSVFSKVVGGTGIEPVTPAV